MQLYNNATRSNKGCSRLQYTHREAFQTKKVQSFGPGPNMVFKKSKESKVSVEPILVYSSFKI